MNKNLPIFIIVIVLIAAVIGGIVLFRNNTTPPSNANGPSNKPPKDDFAPLLAKAPLGASPAQSKGDPAARVTLEEFADFSCPTCASLRSAARPLMW